MATPNLSAPITGIGVVELPTTGGFNYNELVINQGINDFPHNPPANTAAAVTPQTVYAGGGASFLSVFSGAPNLAYQWQTNGVDVTGSRFLGVNGNTLTITNANASFMTEFGTYSLAVTNSFGKATNSGMTLIVSTRVPAGLYIRQRTSPYVGPNGNLPRSPALRLGQRRTPPARSSAFTRNRPRRTVMSFPIRRLPPPTLITRRPPMTPACLGCAVCVHRNPASVIPP